ncbi:MAG: hypothetical protein Ta2B_30970 [Termitinemataceae bacterium]|nr:MAG: hypothetical protein Ta2B_30970 [Termitinemataceae bacterium]
MVMMAFIGYSEARARPCARFVARFLNRLTHARRCARSSGLGVTFARSATPPTLTPPTFLCGKMLAHFFLCRTKTSV